MSDEKKYFILAMGKGYVGNSRLWWRPRGKGGYTCDLQQAGLFTLDEARRHEDGIDHHAVPEAEARANVEHHVTDGLLKYVALSQLNRGRRHVDVAPTPESSGTCPLCHGMLWRSPAGITICDVCFVATSISDELAATIPTEFDLASCDVDLDRKEPLYVWRPKAMNAPFQLPFQLKSGGHVQLRDWWPTVDASTRKDYGTAWCYLRNRIDVSEMRLGKTATRMKHALSICPATYLRQNEAEVEAEGEATAQAFFNQYVPGKLDVGPFPVTYLPASLMRTGETSTVLELERGETRDRADSAEARDDTWTRGGPDPELQLRYDDQGGDDVADDLSPEEIAEWRRTYVLREDD